MLRDHLNLEKPVLHNLVDFYLFLSGKKKSQKNSLKESICVMTLQKAGSVAEV